MFESIWHALYVFLISMLPVIELRGAIPVGAGFGLHPLFNALVCIVGNMLPVPGILFLFPRVLAAMKKGKLTKRFAVWLEEHVMKKTDRIAKGAAVGLFLFVAIPLPGTGAWTGSMIAALVGIRKKYAFFSVLAGVVAAACIVTAVSYGAVSILDFLL